MRYLKSLVFLFTLLFGADVLAQSSPQTMSRIRDGALPNNLANVYQFQITFPTTYFGLYTASGTYFYDGTSATFRRWWGQTAGADNITNATPFPWVGNFNYVFDGVTWDRVRSDTWDAAITTNAGPVTVSLTSFFNGAAGQYWTGETWDTAIAGNVAPLTLSLGAFYDTGTTTGYRWQGETIDDSMDADPVAPFTAAYGVFGSLDAAESRRVTGEAWDSSMSAAPTNMNVNAFGVFYNNSLGVNKGAYWTGEAAGDAIGSTGPLVLNIGHFYDGANYRRWIGETYDASMTAAPVAPNVNAFNVFYNGTAAQYWHGSLLSTEYIDDATYAPHTRSTLHGYDVAAPAGQEWKYVNMLSTQADGQAASINTLMTSSFLYGYNGSTFDLLRVGASNELQVTDVATRPGEDAGNDWRKIKKEQTAVYTPAYTDTNITGGAGLTTILAGTEVMSDVNWCVYVKNTDGADAFTDAAIDTSADNSNWASLTWTTCDTLAAGSTCVYCTSNSAYRYIRVQAQSTNDTSARVWYTSNKN